MSPEKNQERVRAFYEQVIGKHALDRIPEYVSRDFVDHDPMPGVPGEGVESARATFGTLASAFPDMTMNIRDMYALDNTVISRIEMRGTHRSEFAGVPATGKSVAVQGIDILRLEDGKAVEHWGQWDMMGMMQQLGAVPEVSKA